MGTAYSTRREGPGRHRATNRKKTLHNDPEITETNEETEVTESAAGTQAAAQLLTFTIDAKTGQLVKFESLDESGARHELSDEEKANLAREGIGDRLEQIVEQAFEAGIACVLGGDNRGQAQESEQDAELRHLLLLPLIEHSMAKRLMQGDVLNRAILGTLIQHSMKAGSDIDAGGSAVGLQ
jgi:hypothetical protein